MSDNPAIQHPELTPSPAPTAERWGPDGKYASKEAWEQATRASEQEGARLARELQAAQSRIAQMESALRPANPTPQDPFRQLNEIGIPEDVLMQAVDARIGQVFGPIGQQFQARQAITQDYPDYDKHEPAIMRKINSDPQLAQDYNAMLRVNPYRAMEWAIGIYSRSNGTTPPADNPANGAIPGGSTPDNRAAGAAAQGADERLKQAFDYYQKFGDTTPLRREYFGMGIHPDLPKGS